MKYVKYKNLHLIDLVTVQRPVIYLRKSPEKLRNVVFQNSKCLVKIFKNTNDWIPKVNVQFGHLESPFGFNDTAFIGLPTKIWLIQIKIY